MSEVFVRFLFEVFGGFRGSKVLPEPPARLVVEAVAEVVPAPKMPSRVVDNSTEAVVGLLVLEPG